MTTPVHLWPFGVPLTDTSRCTQCGITWAGHYSTPGCEPHATPALQPGQLVRLHPALIRGWHDRRAADGASNTPLPQAGQVTAVFTSNGYCGTCDDYGMECTGPWYTVDFGDGDSTGLGGMYSAHELETR